MSTETSTFAHQTSLPRLPVPVLEDTCKLYLETLKPLLDRNQYAYSEAAVAAFISGPGKKLQQALLDRQANLKYSSWLIDWWNDYAYMAYRDPIVVWVSYFFVFKDDLALANLPAARAASLVRGAMQFRDKVISETLEPDMAKKSPLCMDQYRYMFNSTRIPMIPSDITRTANPSENNHIIVMRNNSFFVLDTTINGKHLSTAELESQFRKIYSLAGSSKDKPIGLFTSEHRDTWTKIRQRLMESRENADSLDIIERAAFAVCLDSSQPARINEASRACWHGDGSNRYFDKSLQLIVFDNAKAGFNGEHSRMDATPPSRMCDWILESIAKGRLDHGTPIGVPLPTPVKLEFNIESDILEALGKAKENFDKLVHSQSLTVCIHEKFGKNLIKALKISPDAFAQMAIQLGYYKMNGYVRATYESAQTRKFEFGRTETCRSVSIESKAWVEAMADSSVSSLIKGQLGRLAVNAQTSYMQKCVDALGVDRHLLGLRLLIPRGEPKPDIFTDPAYAMSSHWNLSTSQITSEYYDGYGWGEVVPDGWGVAYMVKDDSLQFNLVCLENSGLDGQVFQQCIKAACDEMREVFEASSSSMPAVKAKL